MARHVLFLNSFVLSQLAVSSLVDGLAALSTVSLIYENNMVASNSSGCTSLRTGQALTSYIVSLGVFVVIDEKARDLTKAALAVQPELPVRHVCFCLRGVQCVSSVHHVLAM